MNDTTQHNTTQHNTTQHNTTQHNCSLNKNRSHKRLRYIKELFAVEWLDSLKVLFCHPEQQYRHPELVSGSINIKFERLLTRIRSCTTLFCCMKNYNISSRTTTIHVILNSFQDLLQ
ncbi:MAG: hypothetical protein E7Z93_08615, partial [Cyanobacteria bacterium SIG32]|nr:hypothetical protein [Cyanobacteria bacterium SIG32]